MSLFTPEEKKKMAEENIDDLFKRNEIGKIFRSASLEDVFKIHPEIQLFIENFLKNKSSLIFFGPPGRGKTYILVAIMKELIKKLRFYQVCYCKTQRIDNECLEICQKGESVHYFLSKISEIDFLFLDDLGTERNTDRWVRDLYQIIDYRWSNDLPTVISTNLKPPQFVTFYGEKIASRFQVFEEIFINGDDLRSKKI